MSFSKSSSDDIRTSTPALPNPFWVNGALVLVQTMFGIGSVVGALGLPAFNPLVFALIREVCAGLILFVASVVTTGIYPTTALPYWRRFAGLGFFIFLNQACMIIGIKLSNAVAGSIWQPSQPIMTAAICMFMQWEPFNTKRLVGIVIAFIGCAIMVALSSNSSESNSIGSEIAGNIFFFFNCLGTALYVIFSKKALVVFPSICVTAWSYLFAMVYMAFITCIFSTSYTLMRFLCPDCEHHNVWHVPEGALWALAYWIIFNSALAYSLLTWANKYATGTLVMGYTVLQPVTALVLTVILILTKAYANCDTIDDDDKVCLGGVGYGDFGAIGVFIGLYLIISTEPKESESFIKSSGYVSGMSGMLAPLFDPPAYARSASYSRSPFVGDPDGPFRDSGISQFTDFSGCGPMIDPSEFDLGEDDPDGHHTSPGGTPSHLYAYDADDHERGQSVHNITSVLHSAIHSNHQYMDDDEDGGLARKTIDFSDINQ